MILLSLLLTGVASATINDLAGLEQMQGEYYQEKNAIGCPDEFEIATPVYDGELYLLMFADDKNISYTAAVDINAGKYSCTNSGTVCSAKTKFNGEEMTIKYNENGRWRIGEDGLGLIPYSLGLKVGLLEDGTLQVRIRSLNYHRMILPKFRTCLYKRQ